MQKRVIFADDMTRAIVFDIGGVLVDLDTKACVDVFIDSMGFEKITDILDPSHQKGIFGNFEEGLVSADEFRAWVLERSRPGCRPEDVDRCMWALLVGMNPDTAAAVKSVAGRYPLYLLSNNNPINMQRCHAVLAENGLADAFTGEFISCDMKMLKPSAQFYNEVVRRLGLAPEEILFIDDSISNVEGAKAVGINARLFVPGTPLANLLP